MCEPQLLKAAWLLLAAPQAGTWQSRGSGTRRYIRPDSDAHGVHIERAAANLKLNLTTAQLQASGSCHHAVSVGASAASRPHATSMYWCFQV
jgi:hypothetical protein